MLIYEITPTPIIAGQSNTVAYLTTYLTTFLSVERSSIKPNTWVHPALYEINPVKCGYSDYLSSGNDLIYGLAYLHLLFGRNPKFPHLAFEYDICAIKQKNKWNIRSDKIIEIIYKYLIY